MPSALVQHSIPSPAPESDPVVGGGSRGAGGGGDSSRRAEIVAWLGLLLLVALVVAQNLAFGGPPPADPDQPPAENLELLLQAQYLIGIDSLGRSFEAFDLATREAANLDGLEQMAATPRERLALVPVLARLGSVERARDWLGGLRADLDLAEELHGDAEALDGLLAEPPVVPEPGQQERLRRLYGWFGELALARADAPGPGGGTSDPVGQARTMALVVGIAVAAGLTLFAVGVILLFFALVSKSRGGLRSAYWTRLRQWPATARAAAARVPYLESIVVFVLALQLLGLLGGALVALTGSLLPLLLNWLALPAALWPLIRGRRLPEVLDAVGWRRGRGVLREIGAGVVGYLAAMPLLALGLMLTTVVDRWIERPAHHPIVDWIRDGSPMELFVVYLLAIVWAPIAEESLFRGSFFHALRGRLSPLAASLVVGLIFAVVHPQGAVGVPFLVSLALALGLVREWRGSLIAPMTMHGLHNTLALGLMTFLMR